MQLNFNGGQVSENFTDTCGARHIFRAPPITLGPIGLKGWFFMNKLRRVRSLSPEMAETLRLAGVPGIFWAAMAVGNYQTVYLQSIGFPATDFGLSLIHI